jgi:hypothetical protein
MSNIDLRDGSLILSSEMHSEEEDEGTDYVRMERTYSRFYRRLPVGYDLKPDQITATLKDGVLEVRIPERSESTEHRPGFQSPEERPRPKDMRPPGPDRRLLNPARSRARAFLE